MAADSVQSGYHVCTAVSEPCVEHRNVSGEGINHRQDAQFAAGDQFIMCEVHCPDIVWPDCFSPIFTELRRAASVSCSSTACLTHCRYAAFSSDLSSTPHVSTARGRDGCQSVRASRISPLSAVPKRAGRIGDTCSSTSWDRAGSGCRPSGSTPSSPRGSRRPASVSGQPSELSFDDVLEHFFVQSQVRHDLLQLRVLLLEFAQPFHLRWHQASVLLLPIEVSRPADPGFSAKLRDRRAFLTALHDIRLLGVTELRCFHGLPLRSQPRKSCGKLYAQARAFLGITAS